MEISAGDDGIHADNAVAIREGTVRIPACYEGIEAITIDISGGDIAIYPEDDGLNANGATGGFGGRPGGSGPGGFGGLRPFEENNGNMAHERPDFERPDGPAGMPQGNPPFEPDATEALTAETETSATETWIHVSGGSITVVNDVARDADGLDSNGDIIISGGVIRVSLTNSGSNSALDYGSESGGVMEISGGDVIACGSYAMAEGFGSGSTQCSVLYNIKRGAAAGTELKLEDSNRNVLRSYEVPCSFSSIAISCPEMQIGETYSIVIGDSAEEITLEEISASFGDAQSEGFDGSMNWGGMKFRR